MGLVNFSELNQSLDTTNEGLTKHFAQRFRCDETQFVENLLKEHTISSDMEARIVVHAKALVTELRKRRLEESGLDAFLYQYDLSSEEGIALMCMAEALLRVPDSSTIDKLIRDKLSKGDWESHVGKSHSMFVNAATWALMLTGKVITPGSDSKQGNSLTSGLRKLVAKGGEPFVRQAVQQAMKILSRQFVMGRTIEEGLKRAKSEEKKGYRYSYDMLGEAAYTDSDAQRYYQAYIDAIESIANNNQDPNPITSGGISVKLTALHPRYEYAHREVLFAELLPRLKTLCKMAKEANINLNIDAEESQHLMIQLELMDAILTDKDFDGWDGFGTAVQAYQKRALDVIDWLQMRARATNRKLMVRLVKGAYWDTEIKHAQVEGYIEYPVFTRKSATDLNYIACVKKLFEHSDVIYPQLATHNANTVATTIELAKQMQCNEYEFQCLHGMGAALYDQLIQSYPCRIYAPVGNHQDLLAYLVRRLLENGANSSFVNRIVDEDLPIEDIIAPSYKKLKNYPSLRHHKIPLPKDIYGESRLNSMGIDLDDPNAFVPLMEKANQVCADRIQAKATCQQEDSNPQQVSSPIDHDRELGQVCFANEDIITQTLEKAHDTFQEWRHSDVMQRVALLNKCADLFEAQKDLFIGLLVLEGGKIFKDAVSEIRETIDFCRYYAQQAKEKIAYGHALPGPTGEENRLFLCPRGVIACISPWNFPLAIFIGQVAASFAAGNTVIAKPASQTPLVAFKAIELMYEAGIPQDVIQYLPASGRLFGDLILKDERIKGVVFTGSMETASFINQTLAARQGPIVPFIAETGGQNAMIVDSTALPEQVVVDVLNSAFQSAGQRCSALRVLYLQDDVADKMIDMLTGAMAKLNVGNPMKLFTDVGPVIDIQAKTSLESHIKWLDSHGKKLYQRRCAEECHAGTYVAPSLYEIDSIYDLKEENFGPILHIIRFKNKELEKVIYDINRYGYGLTLGIHSRIEETQEYITTRANVGNIYVNRNMIGAVVGVQPFGGEGLSGTGPKAGGPHYILRLMTERTISNNTAAVGGNASLMSLTST